MYFLADFALGPHIGSNLDGPMIPIEFSVLDKSIETGTSADTAMRVGFDSFAAAAFFFSNQKNALPLLRPPVHILPL